PGCPRQWLPLRPCPASPGSSCTPPYRRSLGPPQGCHGPGGRHKSGTRSDVPALNVTLTASNSVTVWAYRGDFGLVSAHNSGWNLFIEGSALCARSEDTDVSVA